MENKSASRARWVPEPAQLARVKKDLQTPHDGEEIRYTTCSQNGCFDLCLLKVHLKDGVVTAVETDDSINVGSGREDAYTPFDSFKHGMYQHRACVRGRGWKKDIYSPRRILYPMKRVGERGTRQFERISWDEALDTVAQKYLETREKHGPYSVWMDGFLGMTFDPFANYLPGGGIGAWAIDSFEPHDFADTVTLGVDMNWWGYITTQWWGGAENTTFFDSKLIVLWGFDALLNYPETAYYLIMAKERGVPIIVIDPRYTWSAQVLADQWIPIRPGTDISMMFAVADVMFREDLINHEFVDKWVEPQGLAKWRAYILGEQDGEEKTPEWAEKICGVPAETIREFARLYGRSHPCYMRLVWAAARQIEGKNVARAADYLLALGGNLGVNGSGGTGAGFAMRPHLPLPVLDAGSAPPEYESKCLLQAELWPKAVLLRKKLDRGEITEEQFKAEIGCPSFEPAPNIHSIMYLNSNRNLAVSYFGVNERIEALKAVDFFAYAHYNWENTSTWYADILLPLTHQFFEGGSGLDGIGPFFWGLSPGISNYFIYGGKLVDGPGETRHPWWIQKELAKRLGVGDKFMTRLKDVAWKDFDDAVAQLSREAYEGWMGLPEIAPHNPPPWEEFVKKPIFRVPIDEPNIRLKEEFANGTPLETPSGKIEFYSEYLASADLTRTRLRSKCFGKGDVPPMAMYKAMPEGFFDVKVRKYPLYLVTPHSFYRQHTTQDENRWFQDEYRTSVWLSVPDAKARGIKDGDLVMVYNDVGQSVVPAYVTSRLTPGVTCLIFGRNYHPSRVQTEVMPEGIDRRGSCNLFIPIDYQDDVRGALLCNALVEVKKMDVALEDLQAMEEQQ
jgi:anaerobic dimethyl sulfoxide reductase subunit A